MDKNKRQTDRRTFLKHISLLTASAGMMMNARCGRSSQQGRKPNIIFILSDDLSWGDLGCYGQEKIKTPNIDRLAKEGMRFTNAYSGASVCAPSRSSLMKGLHMGHATVRDNFFRGYRHSLQEQDITVAQVLKQAGYTTGLFGKWGLSLIDQPGLPNDKGFDEFVGYLNQRKAHSYYPEFLWKNKEKILYPQHAGFDHRAQSTYDENGRVIPKGIKDRDKAVYSFDVYSQASREFLRQHKDEPFFLYLAYTIPHGQLIVPDLGSYKDKDWYIGHKEWAGMITYMDNEVGRVLALLKELNLEKNTLIIFAADNGLSTGGYNRDDSVTSIEEFFRNSPPTRGKKGGIYDSACRVPAIAWWPGKIKSGQVNDHIWAFWDFMPTAADVAGVKSPDNVDGISILPTLLGHGNQQEHEFLYWEKKSSQAVRMGKWFGVWHNQEKCELFDLEKDPQQATNLADQQSKVVNRIKEIMMQEHTPGKVWPSPGESEEAFQNRMKSIGAPEWPQNSDG